MKGLSSLLSESNISNLRLFLDRFKSRILEIGAKDEDVSTRLVAIEALNKMSVLDLLDTENSKIIVSMLFETEPKVRTLAAKMIPKILLEKQESIDEGLFSSETFWELNCLCKVFVESYNSINPIDTLDFEVEEQDLSMAEENLVEAQEKDQKEMLKWFSRDWLPEDLHFGIFGVKEALQSLSGILPVVKVRNIFYMF